MDKLSTESFRELACLGLFAYSKSVWFTPHQKRPQAEKGSAQIQTNKLNNLHIIYTNYTNYTQNYTIIHAKLYYIQLLYR